MQAVARDLGSIFELIRVMLLSFGGGGVFSLAERECCVCGDMFCIVVVFFCCLTMHGWA